MLRMRDGWTTNHGWICPPGSVMAVAYIVPLLNGGVKIRVYDGPEDDDGEKFWSEESAHEWFISKGLPSPWEESC